MHARKDDEEAATMIRVARAKSDLRLHTAAIARWDDEGALSKLLEQQKIAKTHEHRRAIGMTDGEQEDS
jgi:hypothetical protein